MYAMTFISSGGYTPIHSNACQINVAIVTIIRSNADSLSGQPRNPHRTLAYPFRRLSPDVTPVAVVDNEGEIKVESGPTDSAISAGMLSSGKRAAGRMVHLRVTNGPNRGDTQCHLNQLPGARFRRERPRHWSRCLLERGRPRPQQCSYSDSHAHVPGSIRKSL